MELQSDYERILDREEIDWGSSRIFERCLGGGGQGMVYLSRRNGAAGFFIPVALKLFSPEHFTSVDHYQLEMERIARVASRVASIQHDNLVDVQLFLRHQNIFIMEMEWIDGYDLRCLLRPDVLQQVRANTSRRQWNKLNRGVVTAGRQQARVKPGLAIAILRACLWGLSALHREGLVHNDLKPSNIMLKRSGGLKLIDIGSAFSITDIPQKTGCTPEYAAYEVLDGQPTTAQSDLASLGYVLLEMISGVRLFDGLGYVPLLKAKESLPNRISQYLPAEEFAYSDLLLPLVRRLIAPDPAERFRSAEEADHGQFGAAAFELELVKSDLSSQYQSDIRSWMKEVDLDEEPGFGGSQSTHTLGHESHGFV